MQEDFNYTDLEKLRREMHARGAWNTTERIVSLRIQHGLEGDMDGGLPWILLRAYQKKTAIIAAMQNLQSLTMDLSKMGCAYPKSDDLPTFSERPSCYKAFLETIYKERCWMVWTYRGAEEPAKLRLYGIMQREYDIVRDTEETRGEIWGAEPLIKFLHCVTRHQRWEEGKLIRKSCHVIHRKDRA